MGWDNMEKRLFKVSCGGGASGVPGKPGTCFPLFATGKKTVCKYGLLVLETV